MKILNVSELKLNDSHNYYGGAIGNIAYNLLAGMAELPGVEVKSLVDDTDIVGEQPDDLTLLKTDGAKTALGWFDDADVITHLYFHEPEYNLSLCDVDKPVVIGMCEAPHPRGDDEVDGVEGLPGVRFVGKRLLRRRFKKTLRAADRVVTVTDHARDYYSEWVPRQRFDVVPYGVDTDRFKPGVGCAAPRILTVSRLIRRRGIHNLIQALPVVRREYPSVNLDIVGCGPQRDALERLAEKLGVRDATTFHGQVDATRLARLYDRASVYAHLSTADGWNQTALEAIASGTPVVATNRGHNPMVVDGETGVRVPPATPRKTAQALIRMLARGDELADRCREVAVERYSWPAIARQYRDVFAAAATQEFATH